MQKRRIHKNLFEVGDMLAHLLLAEDQEIAPGLVLFLKVLAQSPPPES